MPSSSRARLREPRAVLIAALSGRALAEAARASGYVPLVADFFGDMDTRAVADCVVLEGFGAGFLPQTLLPALRRLAAGRDVLGLVCGTGFEDRPWLLRQLAAEWPLLGNGADVVALVKDPLRFAALCAAADVPHPETQVEPPGDMAGWLVKARGGSGGGHVASPALLPAFHGLRVPGRDWRYFQRRAPGTPVSLLILAAAGRAIVLGASGQWLSPAPGQPFRYGGVVRPAGISPEMLEQLAGAVERVVTLATTHMVRNGAEEAPPHHEGYCSMAKEHLTLRSRPFGGVSILRQAQDEGEGFLPTRFLTGLASFDFLVTANSFTLLEINPRPGATLDIFTHPALFAAHVAACQGILPDAPIAFSGAQAAEIVYAERDVTIGAAENWPSGTKDRPNPLSRLQMGEPVCTLAARAQTPAAAQHLLNRRIGKVRARLSIDQQIFGEIPG